LLNGFVGPRYHVREHLCQVVQRGVIGVSSGEVGNKDAVERVLAEAVWRVVDDDRAF